MAKQTDTNQPTPKSASRGSLIGRIFTSTAFSVFIVIVAALSLVILYSRGRAVEAAVGGCLLAIAAFLIYRGTKAERSEDE